MLHGSASHLAYWAAKLDGFARQVVLMPREVSSDLQQRVLEQVAPDCVIADASVADGYWGERQMSAAKFAETYQACAASSDTQWIVTTSGTTSTPKLVAHTATSLGRTVVRKPELESMKWGLLYDVARFAGTQVYFQALLGGGELLCPDTHAPLQEQAAWLAEHGCNGLSATPSIWRKLLMTPAAANIPLQRITIGGEIVDGSLLKALEHTYPDARITHIYASTEAGAGFAVYDHQPGFPVSYLSKTINGNAFAVRPDDNILMIKPGKLEQHYLGDISLSEDDGWIDTGDIVEIDGDRVYFKGRDNGSINVGGNKVHPEEIENTIRELEFIENVAAYGMSNSVLGNLVAVDVILQGDIEKTDATKQIKQHCRATLQNYKVPAVIKFVSAIEVTSNGKIARRA